MAMRLRIGSIGTGFIRGLMGMRLRIGLGGEEVVNILPYFTSPESAAKPIPKPSELSGY
jgi:hypothetical protein